MGHWSATILGGGDKHNLAGLGDDINLRVVLVSECVSADDNGLSPSRYKSRDVTNNNWFTESRLKAKTKLLQTNPKHSRSLLALTLKQKSLFAFNHRVIYVFIFVSSEFLPLS
jgi:hypothetical protein